MEKRSEFTLIGVITGAAVGAIAGLLMAPASGREVRHKAKEIAHKTTEQARQKVSSVTQMAGRKGGGLAKVSLNRANRDELSSVSGIGLAAADDIVAYRGSHGGFKTVSELENVVGASTYTAYDLGSKFSV